MSAQPAIDYLAERHAERVVSEPDWLTATRKTAMAYVAERGLPTTRYENWKYTNLRSLHRKQFTPAAAVTIDVNDVPQLGANGFHTLSFVNGQPQEIHPGSPAQLMSTVFERQPDALAGRLSALVSYESHPLAALNTAFFADGVVIEVKAGQHFDQPLLLEFVSAPAAGPALICPRVLIVLEANTRLQVIERYVGLPDSENFTNAVTEVHLASGAHLDHYRLQEATPTDTCAQLLAVHQAADSRLNTHSVDTGGKLVRNDLHTWLCGPGAEAHLSGFYMAVRTQHVDNHTVINHNAPHTTSREVYRGVLADRARAVFNGKVVVAKDAQKTDARQSNNNLILSGKAEIDTKPELEIFANDVKASHGATVGQLDDEALFYLRTRGIGERTARALLTFAFADEVLAAIEIPELRKYVEETVTRRLPDHERLAKLT
ncbi:MAG: Fe-S cluster assembly protein SufD [Gammaproteobacteria bacterium]|nr:Fe-S cluster assembly protein SufD [Gammaproteobacteria bacterium]MDH3768205.1 Fe-S cluster assembly protein SufD [Gammaproteobacteria bacterium]